VRECSHSRSLATGKVHGWLWLNTKVSVAGCRDHMALATTVMHFNQSSLAQFGRSYLDDLLTTEQVLRQYDADADWDSDSELAAFWVRRQEKLYRSVQ